MIARRFCCRSCNNSRHEFLNECPNCAPLSFECHQCRAQVTVPFRNVCNVCFQSERPFCSVCSPCTTLCDGCDYPVCKQHLDEMKIMRDGRLESVYFCSAFDDKNVCWRAFVRLKLGSNEYADVYFDRDWLTRDLPEINVTRKWAERQERQKRTITAEEKE